MHAKFACLAIAFSLTLPCFVSADKDKKDNKKDNKKPAPKSDPAPAMLNRQMDEWELSQRNLMMTQMRARFSSMDGNRDDFLDEAELAIGFRGKNAKPPVAPSPTSENPPKTAPDSKKYPDQDFLLALDDNNDRRVSLAEYLEWAEDYALSYSRAARNAEETRIRVVDLQLKAAQAASAAQRQAIENQLNQQRLALARQQAALKDRKDNPNDHRRDRKKKDNKK
ncbi:MAG: EF-hand domain-containing protein [Gemmataceae bacterium]